MSDTAASTTDNPQTTPAAEEEPRRLPTDEILITDEDAASALAALASDEGAREVEDPDPESLTSAMPPLEDIPDDAPLPPAAPAENGGEEPQAHGGAAEDGSPQGEHEPGQHDAEQGAQDADADAAPADAGQMDHIEAAAVAVASASPAQTVPFAPVKPTARTSAPATERSSGTAKGTGALAWGSRTDVGRVRTHNEDSFVIRFPLFAVADGMGGHAAGEVASTLAVSSLANSGPALPDDAALGAAIEQANLAVIEAGAQGLGRPGMGTTCTAVVIDGCRMAVGHVGDSRCYLLHAGQLVRVTHDHSYVEELVAAGEITPEEARVHPNRSIITRALGSDPAMKADHFMVDVSRGDRVMLCSDGLSSMVTDAAIEETMISTPAPQNCADALVDLALAAGGHDNVTCVVVDVKDDGVASRAFKMRLRNIGIALLVAVAILLIVALGIFGFSRNTWFLTDVNGYVALYRGIPGTFGGIALNELQEVTSVTTADLSDAVAQRLERGISFSSEDDAREVIEEYRDQIAENAAAQEAESQRISSARASAASGAAAAASGATETEGDAADGEAAAETGEGA